MVKVTTPLWPSGWVKSTVLPSAKVTLPVGADPPETDAVKVTLAPGGAGFADDISDVVVARKTVYVMMTLPSGMEV